MKSIINADKWQHAQDEEIECWLGIKKKLSCEAYIKAKSDYWIKLLARVNHSQQDINQRAVLEVGNGPSGIFILAKDNPEYCICDPLNSQYQDNFPWLFDKNKVLNGKVEDLDLNQKYPIIFAINCIDHCDDINAFLLSLSRHLSDGGYCYLAVNTHNYNLICKIWSRWQKIIEPHHPYQMTVSQYLNVISQYFSVKECIDIEDLIIDVNNKTTSTSLNIPSEKASNRSIFSYFDDELVGKIFIKALKVVGYPQHDFHGVGRSLFRHKLFILSKK